MNLDRKDNWKEATDQEMVAHYENQTWILEDLTSGKTILCK